MTPMLFALQIALQLWLLCSFVTDALAVAAQALVADALGRNAPDEAGSVCRASRVLLPRVPKWPRVGLHSSGR